MKKVNFKRYYDHITTDAYHDVPDEVFDILEEYRKAEQAYHSKINYHKAYYSLDRDDGIEHSALFVSLSPDEIYERKLTREQLLPLPPCPISRQNAFTLTTFWE